MAAFELRYARAFQQVAAAQNLNIDTIRQQVADFAATLDGSRELREFLLNPALDHKDKVKVLDAVSSRVGLDKTVRNFVAVLMDHGRLESLKDIAAEFSTLADLANGIAEAEIVTAKSLSEDEKQLLGSKAGALAGSRVRVTWTQDASLLGGAVIKLGSQVYDGSVRGQLQQLKRHLAGA
ncbi:ATP synthase F1 subunit delta [Terriglobus sp. TAA 43]|uniref:ATP synthase F1 subunit delta n=1 Tax=Terriglobus sp. TAA 43 TaxID=278961 RepID=UPI0006459B49|nr:ATP synthase F1 subunit delta [Terriglobus sp. TAA 43]